MKTLSTEKVCGKCLKPVPCSCARRWEDAPVLPENVKQFIRAYAVLTGQVA